jgi:hypothetical protein
MDELRISGQRGNKGNEKDGQGRKLHTIMKAQFC